MVVGAPPPLQRATLPLALAPISRKLHWFCWQPIRVSYEKAIGGCYAHWRGGKNHFCGSSLLKWSDTPHRLKAGARCLADSKTCVIGCATAGKACRPDRL